MGADAPRHGGRPRALPARPRADQLGRRRRGAACRGGGPGGPRAGGRGTAMSLYLARLAADAVLYEGYLLYPYRSTAAKNQVRWQFGVLGPPGAAAAGSGEEADLAVECLLRPEDDAGRVTVSLRCLQLQRRQAERPDG